MIRNYKQLEISRNQLALLEEILISLHKEVYDANPRNYALYGEGTIDMILQLRAEIDAFLHIAPSAEDAPCLGETGTSGIGSVAHGVVSGIVPLAGTPEPTPSSGSAPA